MITRLGLSHAILPADPSIAALRGAAPEGEAGAEAPAGGSSPAAEQDSPMPSPTEGMGDPGNTVTTGHNTCTW